MTPDEHTNQEFFLDVGDGHQLYVQDWGNKDARHAIFFLHGGPGGGVSTRYRQRFVPKVQRVIFFDQRGCGKSLPYGSLEHNTTDKLVSDITKIADKLNLKTFILAGGSWGATLALVYAIKNPARVHALVVNGIFTGRSSEIAWLDKGRFQTFFPDVWESYLAKTPVEHHEDPSAYHFKRALGSDEAAAKQSAYAYENVAGALLGLDDRFAPDDYDEYDPTAIKMEIYYLANNCFMPENYILDNAHKLTMPVWIVQGRYDMVCPPLTAYELHRKLPDSQLIWTVAGHGNDRPNYDANRTILLQMARE